MNYKQSRKMQGLVVNLMKAAQLEAEMTGEKISPELEKQLKLWGAGIFRLVVMGEIKKGKSSFINAMLGVENLVPVSSNVATSTIFKIRYAKERGYRVYFLPSANREPLDINEYDLAKYGTEDGNPGNIEQVDFIEVKCPAPLLRSGIVIIDTPGLGGLFKAHKQITYQYVPRADAVFFVTDSVESPIGALEIEYLREILKITPNLYFVQTKTSAVDEEARTARKKNNLSILSKALNIEPQRIRYFMLDAELRFASQEDKDSEILAMSGYPRLMTFINDVLQPNQQKLLAARAMLRMRPVFAHLHSLIGERESVVNADTAEKRQQCSEVLEKKQSELREWEQNEKPELLKRIQKGIRELHTVMEDRCAQLRPGGTVQRQIEEKLEEASNEEDITHLAEEMNTKLPAYVTEVTQSISQEIQTRAVELLSDISGRTSETGHGEIIECEPAILTNIREMHVQERGRIFDACKMVYFGGSAGSSMGGWVGLVVGSVIPGIGSIAGAVLGGLAGSVLGAIFSKKSYDENNLMMIRSQMIGQLNQTFSDIFQKVTRSVRGVLTGLEDQIKEKIDAYIKSRMRELESRIKEVQDRAKMTNEEQQKNVAQLRARKALLASIEREVRARFEMMGAKQQEG